VRSCSRPGHATSQGTSRSQRYPLSRSRLTPHTGNLTHHPAPTYSIYRIDNATLSLTTKAGSVGTTGDALANVQSEDTAVANIEANLTNCLIFAESFNVLRVLSGTSRFPRSPHSRSCLTHHTGKLTHHPAHTYSIYRHGRSRIQFVNLLSELLGGASRVPLGSMYYRKRKNTKKGPIAF
jgi:hypothetical protein